MEDLNFDNIGDAVDFDIVDENEDVSTEEIENEEQDNTEEISTNDLFGDFPESVGDDEDIQDTENPSSSEETGDSSAAFYSSIAGALRDEGVLEYLDDDMIAAITDADSFKDALEVETRSRFDRRQQQLIDAMGIGANVQGLARLQRDFDELNAIDPEWLSSDNDNEASERRKQLIFTDYINRGFSQEKAAREVEKSFNAGTDIEDAKEALESLKDMVDYAYRTEMHRAEDAENRRRIAYEQRWQTLSNSIMNTQDLSGIQLDKRTRTRILENVGNPSIEMQDGTYRTKMQLYQEQHPEEFLQVVGTIFTLTDGFKDFNKLVGKIAKNERNNSIRDLEKVLKNQKNYGASPRYVSNGRGTTSNTNSRFTLNI